MRTTCWMGCRAIGGLLALLLWAAPGTAVGQPMAPDIPAARAKGSFEEFAERVQKYVKLQRKVESKLPAMTSTDLPEMITAHQQALARKLREARPHAKAGDLFTTSARDAFRRAASVALGGQGKVAVNARAYMHKGEADPRMRLEVNAIYPDSEPTTALSPELLAAFPPLPPEVAYRVVGRSLVLVDVKSRLIVDVARAIFPPPS